jgi:hypothetical protein
MFTPFKLKNPFAYPGERLPGFDPTHPAALPGPSGIGVWKFVIPAGANMIDLLTGSRGTIGSAPGSSVDGLIGPVFTNTASGRASFTTPPTPTQCTQAFIGMYTTNVGTLQTAVGTSTTGNGFLIGNRNTNFGGFIGSSGFLSNITISVGVPYFCIASAINSGVTASINCTVVNLRTGQIFQANVAPASNSNIGASAAMTFGDSGAGGQGWNGKLAAGMMSLNFLSLAQQKTWAADPWSFWYPPVVEEIIELSLAPFISVGPPPVFVLMPQIVT